MATAGYSFAMSKAEILAEIPKLTKEERHEIRVKLAEMDSDGWLDEDDPLSDADKALLETRLEDMEKHPEKSIPWEEAEARLKARFGE
jgi:putative addiction module component (TIGR02574 family)